MCCVRWLSGDVGKRELASADNWCLFLFLLLPVYKHNYVATDIKLHSNKRQFDQHRVPVNLRSDRNLPTEKLAA